MMPTPNLLIRDATPDDACGVLAMLRERVSEPNLNSSPGEWDVSEEEQRNWLQNMSESAHEAFFLALVGEEIIGSLGIHASPRAALRHAATIGMCVSSTWRNQGIGSALLQHAIEWAKNNQVTRLNLTVYARNDGAIRLYERIGFEIEGRHPRMFCKNGEHLEGLTMGLLLDS